MFYWPHLDLTDYEKMFVAAYATKNKPGVLRRLYRTTLNNTAQPGVPGLENIHTNGQVQISRTSRVFALTFSGDIHAWRLNISTAGGTQFTARLTGGSLPIVSTLAPGAQWSWPASDFRQPDNLTVNAVPTRQISWMMLPLLIEPNWELAPNEALLFDGEAQDASALVLEIGIHVWEFPGMIRGMQGPGKSVQPPRMGAGPTVSRSKGKRG